MTLEKLREYCLSLPGTTEQIQWGADLVFKVGGKMFCVACTEAAPNVMSFKCTAENFADLCERDGIIPAPYMARAQWVALQDWGTLPDRELKPLVAEAYALIRAKLPKKAQAALEAPGATGRRTTVTAATRTRRRAATSPKGPRK